VALANKNARVMWALLARGDSYRVRTASDGPSIRGLTGENQELEYLPKVAKVVLQC
jgi:hypothetical protein